MRTALGLARQLRSLGLLAATGAISCATIADLGAPVSLEQTPQAGAGGSGKQSCLLSSDCAKTEKCLFGVCSVACKEDRDCGKGERCLATSSGNACVSPVEASCKSDECPEGTDCVAGQCRTVCDLKTLPCLEGQACENSVCVGQDPSHDPDAASGGAAGQPSAGKAGASGLGGAGASGGGQSGAGAAGQPSAGQGGQGGGGNAGAGGQGGAGAGGAGGAAGAGSGGAGAGGAGAGGAGAGTGGAGGAGAGGEGGAGQTGAGGNSGIVDCSVQLDCVAICKKIQGPLCEPTDFPDCLPVCQNKPAIYHFCANDPALVSTCVGLVKCIEKGCK